jgi:secreted PhoX family phosphatase
VLFAEEDPQGRLYELYLDKKDPSVAVNVKDRPAVGRIRHEGIEVGSDGAVYVIDELNGGSIFRFVPDTYGDLSSGQLYALKLTGLTDDEQAYGSGHPHTGPFEWVALDRDQAQIDAKVAADWVEATEYGRPEDVEAIGPILYVAETSEDRVLAIDLNKQIVTSFVAAGDNAPKDGNPNFNNPDNLAQGPDGRLWIVEDTTGSDIWVADKDLNGDGKADGVHLFAAMVDSGAEGTGIYFGKDPHTLFVNVQHAAKEFADGTWVITNRNVKSGKIK